MVGTAVLAVALLVLAACVPSASEVPPLEARAQRLNKAIMCPVCPGETIDQSQNPLAAQMRAIVKDKIRQGWTDQQIKDFFVERYGPSVLMEPPREGFNLTVWLVPPVGVALALLGLVMVLRLMRRPPPQDPVTSGIVADEELSPYLEQVRSVLEDEDRSPPSKDGTPTQEEENRDS